MCMCVCVYVCMCVCARVFLPVCQCARNPTTKTQKQNPKIQSTILPRQYFIGLNNKIQSNARMPKTKKVNVRPAKTNSHTRKPCHSRSRKPTIKKNKLNSQQGGIIRNINFKKWSDIENEFGKKEEKQGWFKKSILVEDETQKTDDLARINKIFDNLYNTQKHAFCNSQNLPSVFDDICYDNLKTNISLTAIKRIITDYFKQTKHNPGIYVCIVKNTNEIISKLLPDDTEICVIFKMTDANVITFLLGYILKACPTSISNIITAKLGPGSFYVYKNLDNKIVLCTNIKSNIGSSTQKTTLCIVEGSPKFSTTLTTQNIRFINISTIFTNNELYAPYFPENDDVTKCGNILLFQEDIYLNIMPLTNSPTSQISTSASTNSPHSTSNPP